MKRIVRMAAAVILQCYPRRFRREYGAEILKTIDQDLDDAMRRGRIAFARAAVREIATAAAGVLSHHRVERSVLRPTSREHVMHAIHGFLEDVRLTMRIMRASPAFSVVALFTIALAVGANTAMYSVVNGVLLKPLPYPDPGLLVTVAEHHPGATTSSSGVMLTNITHDAWSPHASTIQGIGAYASAVYTLSGDGEPERLRGARLSPSLLGVLGIQPLHGRWFTDDEAKRGARVAMVGERFAERRFGTTNIVGRQISLDDARYEIVGVMPEAFRFPRTELSTIFTPFSIRAYEPGSGSLSFFTALARLKPNATPQQAAAQATAAARGITRPPVADALFGKGGQVEVQVRGLADGLTARVRPALSVLTAGFALLLLLACANLANLFLARGSTRGREFAVRAAIGASRSRLLRQSITESLVIALSGGALGGLLGWMLVRALPVIAPADFPRVDEITFDRSSAMIAATAAMFTGVIAGALPAVRGAYTSLSPAMRRGDARSTHGGPVRATLLAVQAGLSTMLLIGALLAARSFANVTTADVGYNADNVVVASVSLPRAASESRRIALWRGLLTSVQNLPGVAVAGAGASAPFMGSPMMQSFRIPGLVQPDGTPVQARARTTRITPGYIEALGMRVIDGRPFAEADEHAGIEPLLVNEAFARAYFNDGRPVAGRRVTKMLGFDTIEIVGVVGDVRRTALDPPAEPQIYFLSTSEFSQLALVARAEREPMEVVPAVKAAIRAVDSEALVENVGLLSGRVDVAIAEPRFSMMVLATIAVIAVLLAGFGLYGALSNSVSQRRREIGIRAALGANRGHLTRLVFGEGIAVTSMGIAAGLAGAVFAMRLLSALLYGVAPTDVMSFAAAAILLLLVAAAASWIPARRAASVPPVETLRAE